MNLTEAIHARRAVRAYGPRDVDETTVRSLVHAAVQAPSAMNSQDWVFGIVQNAQQLKRYSDRAKAMLLERAAPDDKTRGYADLLRSESFNIFYDARTLIVIGVTERGAYSDANCWLAAENLMLAACDAGLGTCCIGFAIPLLNTRDVKAELGWPAAGVAIAPIIVGYPSVAAAPIPRKEPRILTWSR
jgi:nitroreductase